MLRPAPLPLVIAVRAYPDLNETEDDFKAPQRKWRLPDAMFVFDTETRIDQTQRLTFGSYRFTVPDRPVYERLFCADDLPAKDHRVLERYVADARKSVPRVFLLTRRQFVDKLFSAAYRGRCLLIAFNFPFDVSRVAYDFKNARRRFAGGFSFDLWSYTKSDRELRDQFRPSVGIKQIDSKRALKGFTGRVEPDPEDLIPEGSTNG